MASLTNSAAIAIAWQPHIPCPPYVDAAWVDHQILMLENSLVWTHHHLAHFRAVRSWNNGRVNGMHDPLMRLPVELVKDIFMYLRPLPTELDCSIDVNNPDKITLKSLRMPLLLGAVCRSWRVFAWSIPQLWSAISVDVYNTNPCWLSRSGQLPLSIYVYSARKRTLDGSALPHPYGNERYIRPIMEVLVAYSEKWSYLNLDLPKRFIQSLFRNGQVQTPMLERLFLKLFQSDEIEDSFMDAQRDRIKLGNTPNLTNIHLSGLMQDEFDMDWSSVTHLDGSFFAVVACFEILLNMPSLVHLCVRNLYDPDDELDYLEGRIIRHQNLRSLRSLQLIGPDRCEGAKSFFRTSPYSPWKILLFLLVMRSR
ncbi:hypothetical protein BDN70DRAFT_922873 [Pholiota conissans]|uniref:F-box domain-containing protein n=1 Tax=Pholiota conissans TaxID=109636 RepID=A0A9P5YYK1_9AGAR|nr:hypothetical protein BDN70DRAFT_922873 [Pholiota conissans]